MIFLSKSRVKYDMISVAYIGGSYQVGVGDWIDDTIEG